MKGWTQEHIDKLQKRGLTVAGVIERKSTPAAALRSIPREEPHPLKEMKQVLRFMHIDFVTEYKFLEGRKFRFDIAIPEKMVAIEYEGLFANKSRHTTLTGYSMDTVKYNLAVLAGWKVLRYTQLTYKQFLNDIKKLL